MKRRWMKSVIETSKQATPALPFQRGMRKTALRNAGQSATPVKAVRTA
ncbi:MAG: hypothetical protein RID23_12205 [Roseovarius sp.]